jgi:ABC-type oligopeptide transport system substrate-binding subunit
MRVMRILLFILSVSIASLSVAQTDNPQKNATSALDSIQKKIRDKTNVLRFDSRKDKLGKSKKSIRIGFMMVETP